MMRMKYVLQNLNVLNGFLIIVAAAMSYYIVIPILHPDIGVSLPVIKETITETNTISTLPQNASLSDYALIGNQNLFHPERIIPPEKADTSSGRLKRIASFWPKEKKDLLYYWKTEKKEKLLAKHNKYRRLQPE
jgi:hypothetical protein